jgi:hypothetical protein
VDEFISAMSIAHSSAVLLPACLTHYRLRDENQYQFRADDPVGMRRKLNSLSCLARELTAQLAAAGIPEESIEIIVDPTLVTVGRMKLRLDGGMPWQTYFVEQEDFRLRYSSAGLGYRVYKQILLLLTLILPPRTFYRLTNLYAEENMRRHGGGVAKFPPASAIQETLLSRRHTAGK